MHNVFIRLSIFTDTDTNKDINIHKIPTISSLIARESVLLVCCYMLYVEVVRV